MTDPRTPTSDPVAAAWEALDNDIDDGLLYDTVDPSDVIARHRPLIEEAIRQQARAAFAAQVAAGAIAIHVNDGSSHDRAMAWSEGYSEGFAAASPEPASPEAPGSGADLHWLTPTSDPAAANVNAAPEGTASSPVSPHGRRIPASYTAWTDQTLSYPDAARPDGTDPVPGLVAGVPQREPVGDVPGQGAVTEPVLADLCGAVMATCRNEPGHDGEHWHPGVRPDGAEADAS